MPLHEYRCPSGHVSELLLRSIGVTAPDRLSCPECGESANRRIGAPAQLGRAHLPPPATAAPTTWEATHGGDRELVTHWRRTLDARRGLEERHPELATKRAPVLAHEGPHVHHPLTAPEKNAPPSGSARP
jgi:hypothetical protein